MRIFVWLVAALALGVEGLADENVVISWKGAALKTWAGHHQCTATTTDEGMTVVSKGTDPFLVSPVFEMPKPSIDHLVIIRAKASKGGAGELFYYRPGDRAAPQALAQSFTFQAGEDVREYRVRPYWGGQPKVRQLRLDFPAVPNETYLLTEVSIVLAPISAMPPIGTANPNGGVAFTLPPQTRTVWADVEWLSDDATGRPRAWHHFHVIGDGRARRYYFEGSRCTSFEGNGFRETSRANWKGAIREFIVRNSRTGEEFPLKDVVFTDSKPSIPGELTVTATEVPLAFNRVGQVFPVEIGLFNPGTESVRGVRCEVTGLPDGVRLVDAAKASHVIELPGWQSALHRIDLMADRSCVFTLKARFTGGGIPEVTKEVPVKVTPSLGLSKAVDYIPEPKPLAKGDYEVGAYYFCDWVRPDHWGKIWRTDPKRKPALGWYNNLNPEALDWQIKWAVENGISFYLVDWYNFGSIDYFNRSLEQARFRKYIKWALMWCNHIPAPNCREEVWRRLVKGWIEKYFRMPEYLQVNGMPYVSIWDPDALDRDNGGAGGCRRMLEIARQMAREAGLKGIWFQGMANDDSSPEAGRRLQERRKAQGLDETTVYHYLGTNGKQIEPRQKLFADVAASSYDYWKAVSSVKGITLLPNLSTCWNDSPWNDGSAVTGRTPELFRRICADAKRFGDETGVKRFCLAPLNEWGEGSYAEPNGEFGFGMFEAVRETFFEKPADGWPLNYTPSDVGRGPYPIPKSEGVIPHPHGRPWR